MVRFTLMNRESNAIMRMDAVGGEKVGMIITAATEAWGCRGVVLRDGYSLLDPANDVNICVGDDDLVEVLPDPFAQHRWREIQPLSRVASVFLR